MTYTISVPLETYSQWHPKTDWWQTTNSWVQALLETHPDTLVEIEWSDKFDPHDYSRIFTFKSEEHYTWFLLQQ